MKVFLVIIVTAAVSAGLGFYAGSKFSFNPVTAGLSTLGDIAYDNQAEAKFNTQIGVLDAQLAEKDMALAELEKKNNELESQVASAKDDYSFSLEETREKSTENTKKFTEVSNNLEAAIAGNKTAQNDLLQLNNLFASEKNLFQEQLDKANGYIAALEESNSGLKKENTLLRNINDQITQQNSLMRERIDSISGSRARQGPGMAAGIDPLNNYGFAMVIGWTISWS